METQNVTLSVPEMLLHKAKLLAGERQISLSDLLTQALAEIVDRLEQYKKARQWHLAWLKRGADLGTQGKISWTREELHDR
jgi:hypothetical protein